MLREKIRIFTACFNQFSNWHSVLLNLVRRKGSVQFKFKGSNRTVHLKHSASILPFIKLLERGWMIETTGNSLLIRNSEVRMVSDESGLISTLEIFEEGVYGLDYEGMNVLDVGMNNGNSSLYFVLKGAKKVVGLEPLKSAFELAVSNLNQNGMHGRVDPINVGLSSATGKAKIKTFSENSGIGYMDDHQLEKNKPADIRSSYSTTQEIEVISLEDLLSNYPISFFDVLKMDCEGCEYKVLTEQNMEFFPKFKRIVLEYHDRGSEVFEHFLQELGFSVSSTKGRSGYLQAIKLEPNNYLDPHHQRS